MSYYIQRSAGLIDFPQAGKFGQSVRARVQYTKRTRILKFRKTTLNTLRYEISRKNLSAMYLPYDNTTVRVLSRVPGMTRKKVFKFLKI